MVAKPRLRCQGKLGGPELFANGAPCSVCATVHPRRRGIASLRCSLGPYGTRADTCIRQLVLQAAVDALTRNLGLEWGHFGIRTAGVAPGPIKGTAGMTKLAPSPDAAAQVGTATHAERFVAWLGWCACPLARPSSIAVPMLGGMGVPMNHCCPGFMWRTPFCPRRR